MSERLIVSFRPAEGAVIRMLGLAEGRGYALRGVTVEEQGGSGTMTLDLEPRVAGRRVEVIAGQLRRLLDVTHVLIVTPPQGSLQ